MYSVSTVLCSSGRGRLQLLHIMFHRSVYTNIYLHVLYNFPGNDWTTPDWLAITWSSCSHPVLLKLTPQPRVDGTYRSLLRGLPLSCWVRLINTWTLCQGTLLQRGSCNGMVRGAFCCWLLGPHCLIFGVLRFRILEKRTTFFHLFAFKIARW